MSSFNPTTKTQEAMQAALQDASAKGNPDIRPAHLLVALLEQQDSIALPVLQAAGVEPQSILAEAKRIVNNYPQASGSNMANPQFNRDALNALTAAQELAEQLGSHARAVARACASNPLGLLVPCHRVIGASGALTGYRWGVPRKQALLDKEGAASE